MAKIIPHLWFDDKAVEAAEFYASTFPGGKVLSQNTLDGTPSGSVNIVSIELFGLEFQLISAGPYFKPNPAISFMVYCESKQQVDELWNRLMEGGQALMPLDDYPFSEHYGWLNDKYGFSWQFMPKPDLAPTISPFLMLVGDQCGRAEDAISAYTDLFGGKVEHIDRHAEHELPDQPGTVKYARFSLGGQPFAAMDSAHAHQFAFNEAVSLMVTCDDQAEIDRLWSALSAEPTAEQCGWLKDKFGVSWQITPTRLDEMLASDDGAAVARVTEAFLKMKKFDLAQLEKAYQG